ncbi:KEOPS complex N(6)-L-threonylcarbamoyladenine synthase Kae1 [Methanopyrus sp. KOL6]|uniref:KEOPS complex N(6)-L-threonylcarbamoyladenine synthase Kae1 n=1 Tax=Methanopyrus sp. KOL6 TaxID=1937004 RepID=UPI001E3DDEFF|nr:KEOPS complex N(6)-L-threonylcarbamoyladenine synthase Kae1 [Methanopyrus sp. KOL6]
MSTMICVGIESTAEKLGVGVVTDDGEILANVKAQYVPPPGSGILPREAAEHHSRELPELLERALKNAGVEPEDIDLVAYSQGPGLGPCLRVGATAARTLALALEVPLAPVNHCVAHVEIGKLAARQDGLDFDDPVTLYVSGGNTQVLALKAGRYRVFGETLDLPVGNMLDTFSRKVGLPHPGGPEVERLAEKGEPVELPYTVRGTDVSFSGLLTAALRRYKQGDRLEDVCAGLQETAFAMLVEITERAAAQLGRDEILLTGGVAANRRLSEMIHEMAESRGAEAYTVPQELAGDNGAMIAWTGILVHEHGLSIPPDEIPEKAIVKQRYRVDEASVPWAAHPSRSADSQR